MQEIAIKTTNLTKSFGDTIAVNALNLEIRKGELYGLVGPDGAGKTTTMRLLTAIMDPSSGNAWVAGHSIIREGEALKEKIGYMSQRFGLYEDLTVMENILFYADLYEVPQRERAMRIERLLGFSNLTPFKDRLAGQLSGGMKQKLGLACALIHTPEVLFLDEPTNGVDDPVRSAQRGRNDPRFHRLPRRGRAVHANRADPQGRNPDRGRTKDGPEFSGCSHAGGMVGECARCGRIRTESEWGPERQPLRRPAASHR